MAGIDTVGAGSNDKNRVKVSEDSWSNNADNTIIVPTPLIIVW
jgi:hypothetical protein